MNDRTDLFAKLAQKVETHWRDVGNNLDAFPKIATEALASFSYEMSLSELHRCLADWLTSAADEQVNLHNTFGEPPLTLFNNGRFVVDLYIWRGCDTSIHSHGFRGAFKVLHGQSLQETFKVDFETPDNDQSEATVAEDVRKVDLQPPELELLGAGDLRTIWPDRELTHRVIHLVNPTVTLCVKTINEPEISQWHFFETGLAVKKRNVDPILFKKAYYFDYLKSADHDLAESFLENWLKPLDISTRLNLCENLSMGFCDISEGAIQAILEKACEPFQTAAWFARFQEAAATAESEITVSEDLNPEERLKAHFANCQAKSTNLKKQIENQNAIWVTFNKR